MSRTRVAVLLCAGGLVEGAVFALWPLIAWTLAELLFSTPTRAGLAWTPGPVAPLVLSAVLAFPLLGPVLHLLFCEEPAHGAGWRAPTTELPEGVPYALGAAPDSPRRRFRSGLGSPAEPSAPHGARSS